MKILHVITGLSMGGAERTLHSLLAGGLAERFENYVISLSGEGAFGVPIRKLGVPVAALGMRRGVASVRAIFALRALTRRFQPDIVQGWMYHGNVVTTLVPRLVGTRVPVAWNVRHSLSDLAREKWNIRAVVRGNRLLSTKPKAIIYNSKLSREQHEAFGFSGTRGRVIPNGFDLDRWKQSAEARDAVRRELGIPLEAPVVGHIARYHPMKSHSIYLQAIGEIAARRLNAHFLIVGNNVDAANIELAPLFAALPADRLHILGERDDVERLMSALDVLCMSSSWGEGFPNVLGEAMATSVPCVATDVGDSGDIIGGTGAVVPPGDPGALAAALEDVIAMPVVRRRELGRLARARMEENYSLASAVRQYAEFYECLLSEGAKPECAG